MGKRKYGYIDWALSTFERLPQVDVPWDSDIVCDALVILPMRQIHDSGYSCVDVVPINEDGPMGRCRCASDVIHIEGIGGLDAEPWPEGDPLTRISRRSVPARAWTMDWLPKSKLMRIFCRSHKIVLPRRLSSLEPRSRPVERRD